MSGSLPPPADLACVHLLLFTHASMLIPPLYGELLSYGVRKCVNGVVNTSNYHLMWSLMDPPPYYLGSLLQCALNSLNPIKKGGDWSSVLPVHHTHCQLGGKKVGGR